MLCLHLWVRINISLENYHYSPCSQVSIISCYYYFQICCKITVNPSVAACMWCLCNAYNIEVVILPLTNQKKKEKTTTTKHIVKVVLSEETVSLYQVTDDTGIVHTNDHDLGDVVFFFFFRSVRSGNSEAEKRTKPDIQGSTFRNTMAADCLSS